MWSHVTIEPKANLLYLFVSLYSVCFFLNPVPEVTWVFFFFITCDKILILFLTFNYWQLSSSIPLLPLYLDNLIRKTKCSLPWLQWEVQNAQPHPRSFSLFTPNHYNTLTQSALPSLSNHIWKYSEENILLASWYMCGITNLNI